MEVGTFTASGSSLVQVERRTQILQLIATGLTSSTIDDYFANTLQVSNNRGVIMPPTSLLDLAVLNGDEYALQVAFNSASAGGTFTVVQNIEIADMGGIGKADGKGDTINVIMNNGLAQTIVMSSIDPMNCTAVKWRNYFSMNIVSPVDLPNNTLCIIPMSGIKTLQKNHDLMSQSEILTHSNRIINCGCLREVHPVLYDYAKSTPALAENVVYTEVAKNFSMGYGALATGKVVIWTGDDNFTLSPTAGGCAVSVCRKELTDIAQQVETALVATGQNNNVDDNEFCAAVAAVGAIASSQNVTTDRTQIIANSVVRELPSVKVANKIGIKNFNLASEKARLSGSSKVVNI